MHRPTLAVYEQVGADYAVRRGVQDPDRAAGLARSVAPGRVLDLGCGPGHYLPLLGSEAVGADAARAMVDAARAQQPPHPVVRCDLARLPFDRGAFAGVWASKAHQHLPATDLPLALAELHRVTALGGRVELTLFTRAGVERTAHGVLEEVTDAASGDDLPGRWFTWWDPDRLAAVVTAAGFSVDACRRVALDPDPDPDPDPDADASADADRDGDDAPGEGGGEGEHAAAIARVELSATRALALPDHVAGGMRLLCCGINPSVHAAEAGVGYVTGSNRFWPALQAAGLCDVPRDPRRLLRHHHIGMTDLVKRPTPRASDVGRAEFREGHARLEALCRWLAPAAIVVVGLGAWRDAVGDRTASIGWQPAPIGPTPVYVMPSTSGLNARVPLAELVAHLRAAADGP